MSTIIIPTSYPTDEGKTLAAIVRNKMTDYFVTDKPTSELPTICNCFINNNDSFIKSRVNNLKANLAIREGLDEYCRNYSSVELSANGAAQGTQECINIQDDDNVTMVGDITMNSSTLFTVYSIPTIFFTDISTSIDYKKANEKFFNIICMWLGFPFVDVNSYTFSKSVYIKGKGKIIFNGYENIQTILDKVNTACTPLVNENMQYFQQNKQSMPDLFERYWDIMGSGIVELLNYNDIYSIDGGFGVTAGTPSPTLAPYIGMSQGRCDFGKDLVMKANVSMPTIPILGALVFIFKVKIPNIKWPTITVKDKFGATKTITLRLDLQALKTDIINIVTDVKNVITNAYNKLMTFIINILHRLGYVYDEIKIIMEKQKNKILSGEKVAAGKPDILKIILEIVILPINCYM